MSVPQMPAQDGRSSDLEPAIHEIPIVDEDGEVVGWTDEAPSFVEGQLVHSQASRLLRAALSTAFVEIVCQESAIRAGAPATWQGPWQCAVICPAGLAVRLGSKSPSIGALSVGNTPLSIPGT